MSAPMFVGISVECSVCRHRKKPHGRSAPLDSYYCDDECSGYRQDPQVGCLWPGENDAQFGYPCCDSGARPMAKEEIEKYMADEADR